MCTYVRACVRTISRLHSRIISFGRVISGNRLAFLSFPLQRERIVLEWKTLLCVSRSAFSNSTSSPGISLTPTSRQASLTKRVALHSSHFSAFHRADASPSSRKTSHNTFDPLGYNVRLFSFSSLRRR